MSASSCWAALPSGVLGDVLAILPITAKIASEQVCRSWKYVLQHPQAPFWGADAHINAENAGTSICLWNPNGDGMIHTRVDLPDVTQRYSATQWLFKRVSGFSRLSIEEDDDSSHALATLLRLLYPDLRADLLPEATVILTSMSFTVKL